MSKKGKNSTYIYVLTPISQGEAKIGHFSFTLKDFDLSVGGLPVRVYRTYSTLQKHEQLSFGQGWSIDYQDVKLEKSIHPGKSWKVTSDTLFGFCFKFDKQHLVNVTLPDGSTESFEFRFARECAHYALGSPYDAPKLYALNGSEARLETIDASDLITMNSNGEIIDSNTLDFYNPSRYRLTLPNGMVYELDETEGITRVKNLLNDTLTYTHDGIQSSRGASLTFTRDDQGRITRITDPDDRNVTYRYDGHGNLAAVTDVGGLTATYTYDNDHTMIEYFDPTGTRLAKNYYDENGHLIKTVDAEGNEVEFIHDLDGNEEIVTDKLGRTSVYVYDDHGNVLSQTNPLGETTTYSYDARGNKLSETDPLGHTTSLTYDNNGNIKSITDALGHTETIEYNEYRSIINHTDKDGNELSITYSEINTPKTMTSPTGAKVTFFYDQFGNKIKEIGENNQTTTYKYDGRFITLLGVVSSNGWLLKEVRHNGTVIEHTYDAHGNRLTTTTTYQNQGNPVTLTRSNTYDAYDRLVSSTDERGNTITFTYDTRGNRTSSTDAQGRITTFRYSTSGKLLETIFPDGTTQTKSYDTMDNLISKMDEEGQTTAYAYDGADRQIRTTFADGSIISTQYDKSGRIKAKIDENGNATTFEYDAVGRKLSRTDAFGQVTTFVYSPKGKRLRSTDPLGRITQYQYNAIDQKTKVTYPDGSERQVTRDQYGMPIQVTNEIGNVTMYAYSAFNEENLLDSVTLPDGSTTHFTYGTLGKMSSRYDALGRTTQWSYNDLGQQLSETLPMGQTKSFTYDSYGKQIEVNDYDGKTTRFIYDGFDKLIRTEYADGSSISYEYTPIGRLKSLTGDQGTISYSYDVRGRLTRQDNPDGSFITYGYDNVGNIVSIQTDEQTVTKTYDALNRLKTVTDPTGTTSYVYDAGGRLETISYPNGVRTQYAYNVKNQIIAIEHQDAGAGLIQRFEYTLDAIGNALRVVELSGRTVNYTYDHLNRLTSEVVSNDPHGNDTSTSFEYDAVGNLIAKTVDGVTTNYAYNANDQLTVQDAAIFTYDDNGNMIEQTQNGQTTTYGYGDRNELTDVTTPTDNIGYAYDATGNRIAKTFNGVTTKYLVDSNMRYPQVLQESNGTDSINYSYGHDLLSHTTKSQSYFYHTDALGSTRTLTNLSGTATDSFSYSPFGKLIDHTGQTNTPYLFTGERFDEETENYYLRARYYSPAQSRFIGRDTFDGSAANPITMNHYTYANANPLMYVDPSGNLAGAPEHISTMTMSAELNTIARATTIQTAKGAAKHAAKDFLKDIPKQSTGTVSKKKLSTLAAIFFTVVATIGVYDAPSGDEYIPVQFYGSDVFECHQEHIADAMLYPWGKDFFPSVIGCPSRDYNWNQIESSPQILHRKYSGPREPWITWLKRRKQGVARDEYPYASSIEGGWVNSDMVSVRYVPKGESDDQMQFNGRFYNTGPLVYGDTFIVIPVGWKTGYLDKYWRWHGFP